MPAKPGSIPPAAFASRLTEVEERVARGVVAGHRARLDWLLRVPDWVGLYSAGLHALGLPGQRQGIGQQAAMLALPLESKFELVGWALVNCRHHVRSAIGRRLCRMLGLELFDGLDLDELLTVRQWQRLREAARFRLAQEHRRYKHAQQLLFTGHQHLIAQVVHRLVFRPEYRADCMQEGALGLLAAIDRVDEAGGSLAAYATAWIRRHVRNYLLRQRLPVQAPVNLIAEALTIASEPRATESDSAKAGSAEEARQHRLRVLLLECLRHPAVALDEPADRADGATVGEMLIDHSGIDPLEAAARADLCAWVRDRVAALTPKQREVLVHRFGLGGATARTLAEIARTAGISHQQAGMRERRARQRLELALAPLVAEWYGVV